MSGNQVKTDLKDNHGVEVSTKLVQSVSERVGKILLQAEEEATESSWSYSDPVEAGLVYLIGISRDGTTIPIKGENYKEAMSGTIALYDQQRERLHTIYLGAAPEHGKAKFDARFGREIERILQKYPGVVGIGIADGEAGNWRFLEPYIEVSILDFWHASEYLAAYARVAYQAETQRKNWLSKSCHTLKHTPKGAAKLLREIKKYVKTHKITEKDHPAYRAMVYFTNQKSRMNYPFYLEENLPIGSGVVEAACKTLVKQRFSRSGCRWTRQSVEQVMAARTLILTKGRWQQFWEKAYKNAA